MRSPALRALLTTTLFAATALTAAAQSTPSLDDLSLQDLLNVEVTSVARKEQTIARTAAAIHIITADDIRNSGATTVADVLRLAPGLSARQISATEWSVAARGFAGFQSNKLLVLIDGRSIYSPLTGGVLWEMVQMPLDGIARIEVIRGPGGSLWGANAINGVINIITKSADESAGTAVGMRAGTHDPGSLEVAHGGRLGSRGYYATRGRLLQRRSPLSIPGAGRPDPLEGGYGDVRFDWGRGINRFDVTGDIVDGRQKRMYGIPTVAPFAESFTAVDVDAQQRIVRGRHDMVAGAEYRFSDILFVGTPVIYFPDPDIESSLLTAFVQDEVTVTRQLSVTGGVKTEHNADTGLELQPSVRALLALPNQSFWAAASRAVRTPNRFDLDLRSTMVFADPGSPLPVAMTVSGDPAFQAERGETFELGYRVRHGAWTVDAAAFRTETRGLGGYREGVPSIELFEGQPAIRMPATLTNRHAASSRGGEIAAAWRPGGRWQAGASYAYLSVDVDEVATGSYDNAPAHEVKATASMPLPLRALLTAHVAYAAAVPSLGLAERHRLDLNTSIPVGSRATLQAGALNLLGSSVAEFRDPLGSMGAAPRRELFVRLAWRFR
jgi:iron complex outermembrane receptor protein